LLHELSTTQRELEIRLEEEVKALLQANFDENRLKYWDKDKSYTDIQLKDVHSIVRVKPMRYNQADKQEFKIQLRELEDKQLAFKSTEDNKSLTVVQRSWLITTLNRNEASHVWSLTIKGLMS